MDNGRCDIVVHGIDQLHVNYLLVRISMKFCIPFIVISKSNNLC